MAQTVAISGSSTDRLDTPSQPKSLVAKLAEVMAEVHRVPKRGRNEFQKYDYVMEADLADEAREKLAARGIIVIPRVVKHERVGEFDSVMVEFTLTDGVESLVSAMPGVGWDKGDKGVYKAITGATKYFLMKMFLIPTGDDPEADTRTDKEVGTKAAKEVKQQKLRAQAQETAKEEGGKPGKEVTFDGVVMMDGEEKIAKSGRKYMKVEFCENCPDCDGSGEIGQDDSGNAICKRCASSGLAPKHTALLYQDRYDLLASIGRAKKKMASAKCEEVTHSKGKFYVITDFEEVPF